MPYDPMYNRAQTIAILAACGLFCVVYPMLIVADAIRGRK